MLQCPARFGRGDGWRSVLVEGIDYSVNAIVGTVQILDAKAKNLQHLSIFH
jgi:hypothetical protein